MAKKFLRRTWNRYSKLGKRRKKKQVWRKPKGRDNKMREKRKGYPVVVSIGYKKQKKDRGKIQDKMPFLVYSINDLENLGKEQIVIVGRVGKKKKIEIIKRAKKEKILIQNVNVKKFLKQAEKRKREREEKAKIKTEKKTKGKKKTEKKKVKEKPKELVKKSETTEEKKTKEDEK